MKIFKTQEINFSGSGSEFIDLINDLQGDTVAQEVIIQVQSDCAIALTGTAIDGKAAQSIGAIKMSDLSVVSSISAAGIYTVPAEALSSITLTATGTSVVLVKVVG